MAIKVHEETIHSLTAADGLMTETLIRITTAGVGKLALLGRIRTILSKVKTATIDLISAVPDVVVNEM